MNLKDKVVMVTGAGRGIGQSVASMYAKQGASVILVDQNQEEGQTAAHLIRQNGGEAFFQLADIGRPEDIISLMREVDKQFGRLDILINNAGMMIRKSPYELAIEEWDRVLNVNLRAGFLCSREAAKVMKKHGGGAIVNISSTRAQMSEADTEAYAASKGGVLALTHALAVSLGPDRIRVNAISPGWIETGDYSQLREIDHLQHPSGRVGKPEDIARACLFLTDEQNDFITGANIVIDGGMTRKMIYEH